jgi:hypothetical protein
MHKYGMMLLLNVLKNQGFFKAQKTEFSLVLKNQGFFKAQKTEFSLVLKNRYENVLGKFIGMT